MLGASAQDAPTLYGVKIYCPEGATSGLYKVEAKPGAQPELYWSDGDMMGTGGVVYDGSKLYVLSFLDWFGMQFWTYLTCDVESKTYDVLLPEDLDYLTLCDVGAASTYDPATGNVYTICLKSTDSNDSFNLCTQNLKTAAKTPVAPIEYMVAMAADKHGNIFAIDPQGCLRTVNKHTGETSLIGSTGVVPSANNTAVIDYSTGIMYWNAYNEEFSGIYAVDTTTAEATLITTFDNGMQLDGLFMIQSAVSAAAPVQPTDVTANFTDASLKGTIEFTAPTLDVEGNKLASDVTYTVTTGTTQLASGSAAPGTKVSAAVEVPAAGNYQFSVQVACDGEAATPVNVTLWVGSDSPQLVTDCLLSINGMKVTLTWNLPELGVNGGYVDPATVKYMVIRGPYSETLERAYTSTTFTETLDFQTVEPLMYGVIAYTSSAPDVANMVISNTVVAGEYATVPFVEDLTDPFRQLIFSIHDDNADRCTWEYSTDFNSMTVMWAIDETSNDWLITPPILLEAGKHYCATMNLRSEGRWDRTIEDYVDQYCGAFGFHLGTEPTPVGMTTQLLEPVNVENKDFHNLSTPAFTVPETGLYHIGSHHSGSRSIYQMLFSQFSVTETDPNGIASVDASGTDIQVTASAGTITVSNPAALPVSIVALSGQQVAANSSTLFTVTLTPGVYVVTAPSTTPVKVILH